MKKRTLKVPMSRGEDVRRELIEGGFLDKDYLIDKEGGFLYLPVKDEHLDYLDTSGDFEVVERNLERRPDRVRSYKDLVKVPDELFELLPSSFDVLGDIAIIKLKPELYEYRGEIADALLKQNRNLNKVALDRGVKGEFRVRDLEPVAGGENLETTHVENNLRFKLDPSEVYFSPRLTTERIRIAEKVGEERVLDMFAGVGPFSINIARHGRPEEVVAIDLNPACVKYLDLNIKLNSVDDIVTPYLGDSREVVPTLGSFDRVILNLPHSSFDFLDLAMDAADEGVIHLYSILDSNEVMSAVKRIQDIAGSSGKRIGIEEMREVHNYSPSMHMMAFDISLIG